MEQLKLTVQLAIETARSQNPLVELVRTADATPEIVGLTAWLRAAPPGLRLGAIEMAAARAQVLMGGDTEFWATFFSLEAAPDAPPVIASPQVTPAPQAARDDDGESPDKQNTERLGRLRGPIGEPDLMGRAGRMRALGPLIETLLERLGGTESLLFQLRDLGVASSASQLSGAVRLNDATETVVYVPRARALTQLETGLRLLEEALTPTPEPAPAPEVPSVPPGRVSQAFVETQEDNPFAAPKLVQQQPRPAAPTTRKGRLSYIRTRLREGEVSLNQISMELGLNNVGTASALMKQVDGALHIGNGVYRLK